MTMKFRLHTNEPNSLVGDVPPFPEALRSLLVKYQFQRRDCDDKSGSWYVKRYQHPVLGTIEVTVDDCFFSVDAVKENGDVQISQFRHKSIAHVERCIKHMMAI